MVSALFLSVRQIVRMKEMTGYFVHKIPVQSGQEKVMGEEGAGENEGREKGLLATLCARYRQ